MTWRPTSELPTDGDLVLLWHPEYVDIGWCERGEWFVRNNGDYNYGGYGEHYKCRQAVDYPPPVYWQPLPPPPEEGA